MKAIITFLILLSSIHVFGHKFYVSIAEMEYDSTQNRINVSVKMTAHDFEQMLSRKFDRKIDLEKTSDTSDVGEFMQMYLKQNFQLHSADTQLEMNYLGKEVDLRGELYCYFYFANVPDPTTIKIVNKLLFSISDQQQNIVHYKYLTVMKSVTLVPSQSEAWITTKDENN